MHIGYCQLISLVLLFLRKMVRIIDLSVLTEDSPSEPMPVEVVHEPHRQSVELMKGFFGCTDQNLPGGLGWANDRVNLVY